MSEKSIRARVQHKHKTEAEWILDVYTDYTKTTEREDKFIPLNGELVIFDAEDSTSSLEGTNRDRIITYPRYKFGNGKDNIIALPFSSIDFDGSTIKKGSDEGSLEIGKGIATGKNAVAGGRNTQGINGAIGTESSTFGTENLAGSKAFTITNVREEDKVYCLSGVDGLEVGDVYSLRLACYDEVKQTSNAPQKYNVGKITAINAVDNEVTVDIMYGPSNVGTNCIFTVVENYVDENGIDYETNAFRIIAKPWVGDRVIGSSTMALGNSTQALSKNAHTEGDSSIAYGSHSHAEGFYTQAGYSAHAEGKSTIASGDQSHAEGHGGVASGSSSHVEGLEAQATADQAHAEGLRTHATGKRSHAEGDATVASGEGAHTEGQLTEAAGQFSHAEGYKTQASGSKSHAECNETIASGSASHSEGLLTSAISDQTHAEGLRTTAMGKRTHAEGHSSETAKKAGVEVNTSNENILTKWEKTKFSLAKGEASHVEGYNSLTLGDKSHAEGEETIASGKGSHAEGQRTKASGIYTHAEGYNTTAIGEGAHAEGYNTTAKGNKSHSEGHTTTASGPASHAEGYSSQATGDQSHAEGFNSVSSGNKSHAEGSNTVASGAYSHSGGLGTKATGEAQTAIGKYNATVDDALLIVGNGSSNSDQHNAFVVHKNGKLEAGASPDLSSYNDNDVVTVAFLREFLLSKGFDI